MIKSINLNIRINTLWNLAGSILPLLLGLVTIPILIKGIGNELFGILSLIWIIIGYLSVFDFGIGRALTQRVAFTIGSNDCDKLSSTIYTGLFFTVAVGIFVGIIFISLAEVLSSSWLNITTKNQTDAFYSLLLVALITPITTASNGLRGVLEAYGLFKLVNIIRLFHGTFNFILPLMVYFVFGANLVIITLSLCLLRIFIAFVTYGCVVKNTAYKNTATFSKDELKILLGFGSWMTLSNVVNPMMDALDKFVISAKLGASKVLFYTVPFDLLSRLFILPTAITSVVFPKFSELWCQDIEELRKLYMDTLKLVMTGMLVICLFVGVFVEDFLTLWIDKEFSNNAYLVSLFLIAGIYFNCVARVPFALIQSCGDSKTTAKIHIFECMLYLPVMYYAIVEFGILGAALSWVARVGLDMFVLLFIANIKLNHRK
ncbi:flippase [Shewanella chilikensis]|uniref:flippase n=1 Tax=Shewanella chilikensis TaxID=558541 RepID=UPI00399BCB39